MSGLDFSGLPGSRILGVLGVVAMASWAGALALQCRDRRWREAAWGAALIVLAGGTGLLAFADPEWHVVCTGLVAGAALRNLAVAEGRARWLTAAGLLVWLAAMAKAYELAHA